MVLPHEPSSGRSCSQWMGDCSSSDGLPVGAFVREIRCIRSRAGILAPPCPGQVPGVQDLSDDPTADYFDDLPWV
jgi:hypothetical protein